MKEKTIIKSESYKTKNIFLGLSALFLLIGIIVFAILSTKLAIEDMNRMEDWGIEPIYDALNYFLVSLVTFFPGLSIALIFLLFHFIYARTELTVSNKRIYGKTAFGKQVDLPLDSITSIGTGIFKGISVSTASGKIAFAFIKNRDEIREEITKLLNNRQDKTLAHATTAQSTTDELKKYKELLDCGIITQEEFDAKKKQLLGL